MLAAYGTRITSEDRYQRKRTRGRGAKEEEMKKQEESGKMEVNKSDTTGILSRTQTKKRLLDDN